MGHNGEASSLTRRDEEDGFGAFPNDKYYIHVSMAVTWTFTGICILVVAARFYVRLSFFRKIFWDDWFMLGGMACQIVFQVLSTKSDLATLNGEPFTETIKWAWISIVPCGVTAILIRVSISILLLRLFHSVAWFWWYLIILLVLQVAFGIVSCILFYASVRPIEAVWDFTIVPTRYVGPEAGEAVSIISSTLFSITDLTHVILPSFIVWNLSMSRRRKVGLGFLMILSLFTTAASILRAVTTMLGPEKTAELGFRTSDAELWTGLEQTMVIILGSIPPLLPLAKVDHPAINWVHRLGDHVVHWFSDPTKSASRNRPSFVRTVSDEPLGGDQGNREFQDPIQPKTSRKDVQLTSIHEHPLGNIQPSQSQEKGLEGMKGT